MNQVTHNYNHTKHTFDVQVAQRRVIEKKEQTAASEAAAWEAETCPAHGHGNCHFMCCGECCVTGEPVYKKDWSKYQATLVTVSYEEVFVVCPLCGTEVIISTRKL